MPNKNIRIFGDKPLIAWSIEHAFAVKRIGRVIVSTDSEEIAAIAREYGAEVPFIRPAKLASDTSPEWLSWQHALNYFKETEHFLPDVMLILPATAPLRLPEDIKQCLDIFEQEKVDVVITVTEAHRNPYFNMVSKQEDGSFNLVISPANNISGRQAAPVVYDMTTVAYVVNPQFVLRESSIFAGRVKAVSVPVERAIDIDTKLDFDIAEWLLARNVRRK